jgi:hypothetical protein
MTLSPAARPRVKVLRLSGRRHEAGRRIDARAVAPRIAPPFGRADDPFLTHATMPKENPMFGPSLQTTHLANHRHNERLEHSARIQMVANHRRDTQRPITHEGSRRITVARLLDSTRHAAAAVATALVGSHGAGAER